MANVENLTEENVNELQKVFSEMQQGNSNLKWQFYNQDEKIESDGLDLHSRITILEGKIDTLIRKIDLVFGNAVLINGKFINTGQ